jgi:hypothetical protein
MFTNIDDCGADKIASDEFNSPIQVRKFYASHR